LTYTSICSVTVPGGRIFRAASAVRLLHFNREEQFEAGKPPTNKTKVLVLYFVVVAIFVYPETTKELW
jgi:hypothetical protein